MKVAAVLAFVVAAVSSVNAAAPPCPATLLPELIKAATGGSGAACTKNTGYSIAALKLPTGDVLEKVCKDADCQATLGAITAAVKEDCSYNGVDLKSALIDKFPAACAPFLGGDKPTTAPVTTKPATTAPSTTAPGATTAAPTTSGSGSATEAPETEAPSTEEPITEGSEAESGSGSATEAPVEEPTTAPVPSTTSGASAVVAAAGAVAVAAAASLF